MREDEEFMIEKQREPQRRREKQGEAEKRELEKMKTMKRNER